MVRLKPDTSFFVYSFPSSAFVDVQALRPLVRESLHAGENRLRVEMRFGDDVRLQAAGQPLIVRSPTSANTRR